MRNNLLIVSEKLREQILELLSLELDDYEYQKRLKILIQEATKEINNNQLLLFATTHKNWLNIVKKSNDFSFEIVVPPSVIESNYPNVAEQLVSKITNIHEKNWNKVASRLFQIARWFPDDYHNLNNPRSQIMQDLRIAIGTYENLGSTIINTAESMLVRSYSIAKAELAGLHYIKFEHTAPEREFCQHYGNEIKHKKEWLEMDNMFLGLSYNRLGNGQGLPILTSGGGYNCKGNMRGVTVLEYDEFMKHHRN